MPAIVTADTPVMSAINGDLTSTVWTDKYTIGLKFTDSSYDIREETTDKTPFIIQRKDNLVYSTFLKYSELKEVLIKDTTGDGLPNIRITNTLDSAGKIISSSEDIIIIHYVSSDLSSSLGEQALKKD